VPCRPNLAGIASNGPSISPPGNSFRRRERDSLSRSTPETCRSAAVSKTSRSPLIPRNAVFIRQLQAHPALGLPAVPLCEDASRMTHHSSNVKERVPGRSARRPRRPKLRASITVDVYSPSLVTNQGRFFASVPGRRPSALDGGPIPTSASNSKHTLDKELQIHIPQVPATF
jgi:hypothetical protein